MEPSKPSESDTLETWPSEQANVSNAMTAVGRHESIDAVRECLNRTLRVCLLDGRVVEGVLECFDNLGNMLLRNATEVSTRCYRLGTVLVPARVQTQVLVRQPTVDELAKIADGLRVASNLPSRSQQSTSSSAAPNVAESLIS